jgi:hypothetical protein
MVTTEKHTVSGDQVLGKVKELIREGNVRKVRLLQKDKVLLEIPLTVGAPVAAIGILALPLLAAIGAVAALLTECTIEIEKVDKSEESKD